MMRLLLLICFLLPVYAAFAQPTQSVRGKIFDSESNFPLYGAKIEIFTADSLKKYRALSNLEGTFVIPQVPIGKHQMVVSFLTYDTKTVTIEVNSGKETITNIPMSESYQEQS